MFVGAHDRQLDDKGRVALPATYRAHLGERCYLVKGTDKCVEVIVHAGSPAMSSVPSASIRA